MLGIVSDFLHGLIGGGQVAAEKALGVDHWAMGPQLVPDGKRIFRPPRIGVVEIVNPVFHRRMFAHGAGRIGHRAIPLLCSLRSRVLRFDYFEGQRHSSITSIAISGQLDLASQALPSRPAGTEPSPRSRAFPNSSRSKSSGASDLQRAWP